jgi:hypothetical protein
MGYSAEYAWWVHENMEANHHPPTKAKFLEEVLQMNGSRITQAIHIEVNRILGI